jgi:hypothetical protein
MQEELMRFGYQCNFFTTAETTLQTMLVFGVPTPTVARAAIEWFIGEPARLCSCSVGRFPLPYEWLEVTPAGIEYHTVEEMAWEREQRERR